MKGIIFVPRHYNNGTPSGFNNVFRLNNPVGMVYSPCEVCHCGVAAPYWALFFYHNLRHHAHRNHNTLRKGTPDHPGQVAQTGSRNAEATARLTPRIYSTKVGGKRAGKTPIIHSISVF